MNRYQTRRIRHLQLWDHQRWRMKIYGLSADRLMPSEELVSAGKRTAATLLDVVASRTSNYHLGFMGVHRGRDADVVFVDWWAAENELHHHLYVADGRRPEALRPRKGHEFTACVWDLEVVAFEREAWVSHVLMHPGRPRWEEYLSSILEKKDVTP